MQKKKKPMKMIKRAWSRFIAMAEAKKPTCQKLHQIFAKPRGFKLKQNNRLVAGVGRYEQFSPCESPPPAIFSFRRRQVAAAARRKKKVKMMMSFLWCICMHSSSLWRDEEEEYCCWSSEIVSWDSTTETPVPGGEEDDESIDRRAEKFIQRFYQEMRIQKSF